MTECMHSCQCCVILLCVVSNKLCYVDQMLVIASAGIKINCTWQSLSMMYQDIESVCVWTVNAGMFVAMFMSIFAVHNYL